MTNPLPVKEIRSAARLWLTPPFTVTGEVNAAQAHENGFMVEINTPAGHRKFSMFDAKLPEWLKIGALIEVDFEKGRVTLCHE